MFYREKAKAIRNFIVSNTHGLLHIFIMLGQCAQVNYNFIQFHWYVGIEV